MIKYSKIILNNFCWEPRKQLLLQVFLLLLMGNSTYKSQSGHLRYLFLLSGARFLVTSFDRTKKKKSMNLKINYIIRWRRQWQPTPVFLPGKSHGRRSLVGCSPWGRTESDTTERLHFHFSLSCFREGNGNPLQCSCLENPRDGGAWWAAVYGVA